MARNPPISLLKKETKPPINRRKKPTAVITKLTGTISATVAILDKNGVTTLHREAVPLLLNGMNTEIRIKIAPTILRRIFDIDFTGGAVLTAGAAVCGCTETSGVVSPHFVQNLFAGLISSPHFRQNKDSHRYRCHISLVFNRNGNPTERITC